MTPLDPTMNHIAARLDHCAGWPDDALLLRVSYSDAPDTLHELTVGQARRAVEWWRGEGRELAGRARLGELVLNLTKEFAGEKTRDLSEADAFIRVWEKQRERIAELEKQLAAATERADEAEEKCARYKRDGIDAIQAAHALLDSLGIPSAAGEPCDVDDCNFQIVHRIHTLNGGLKNQLAAERVAKEAAVKLYERLESIEQQLGAATQRAEAAEKERHDMLSDINVQAVATGMELDRLRQRLAFATQRAQAAEKQLAAVTAERDALLTKQPPGTLDERDEAIDERLWPIVSLCKSVMAGKRIAYPSHSDARYALAALRELGEQREHSPGTMDEWLRPLVDLLREAQAIVGNLAEYASSQGVMFANRTAREWITKVDSALRELGGVSEQPPVLSDNPAEWAMEPWDLPPENVAEIESLLAAPVKPSEMPIKRLPEAPKQPAEPLPTGQPIPIYDGDLSLTVERKRDGLIRLSFGGGFGHPMTWDLTPEQAAALWRELPGGVASEQPPATDAGPESGPIDRDGLGRFACDTFQAKCSKNGYSRNAGWDDCDEADRENWKIIAESIASAAIESACHSEGSQSKPSRGNPVQGVPVDVCRPIANTLKGAQAIAVGHHCQKFYFTLIQGEAERFIAAVEAASQPAPSEMTIAASLAAISAGRTKPVQDVIDGIRATSQPAPSTIEEKLVKVRRWELTDAELAEIDGSQPSEPPSIPPQPTTAEQREAACHEWREERERLKRVIKSTAQAIEEIGALGETERQELQAERDQWISKAAELRDACDREVQAGKVLQARCEAAEAELADLKRDHHALAQAKFGELVDDARLKEYRRVAVEETKLRKAAEAELARIRGALEGIYPFSPAEWLRKRGWREIAGGGAFQKVISEDFLAYPHAIAAEVAEIVKPQEAK